MYRFLKKNIKSLIPNSLLFKYELVFRYPYGIFFIGKSNQCNICDHKIKYFAKLNSTEKICPFCGSISRTRRLYKQLKDGNYLKGNVLHFSPSRSLYRNLKRNKKVQYYSTDFEGEFLADYNFDITNINQKDKKFDLIICYHILEHIIDDRKAISELYRVLNHSGIALIQTPFKEGDIYEDYSITSAKDRLNHFGQEDHVRIYSVNGLKNRLEDFGFNIEVKSFSPHESDDYFGLKSPETILKLTK